MPDIKLSHSELISKEGTPRILTPDYIPIHPVVYSSDIAYTPEFVSQVKKAVPDAMKEDLYYIEKALGSRFDMEVREDRIVQDWREVPFRDVWVYTGEKRNGVDISFGNSNIGLYKEREIRLREGLDHPMDIEKLRQYAVSRDDDGRLKILRWYVHNQLDHGLVLSLYFRNFAIVFNNHGLEMIVGE